MGDRTESLTAKLTPSTNDKKTRNQISDLLVLLHIIIPLSNTRNGAGGSQND